MLRQYFNSAASLVLSHELSTFHPTSIRHGATPRYVSLAADTRLLILTTFLASVAFVQFRGRVRHKLSRVVAARANLLAPYNTLMYLFSAVKAKPYADLRQFPKLRAVNEQWQMIRAEALQLFDEGHIRAASGYNDIGFNTFFKRGWKRFYLKWYGDFLPSAQALCPKTAELLSKIPSINATMFTLLPPGSRLGAHRDPFAGSLRYHLG